VEVPQLHSQPRRAASASGTQRVTSNSPCNNQEPEQAAGILDFGFFIGILGFF
jgi:hypothetical protein